MISTVWLWPLITWGLVVSGTFLLMHRPRIWWRTEALNSAGWVVICFLLFLRGFVLLVLGIQPAFSSLVIALTNLGFTLLVDLLLTLRLVSFIRFLARGRKATPEDLRGDGHGQ